jgi:hypothetical protein
VVQETATHPSQEVAEHMWNKLTGLFSPRGGKSSARYSTQPEDQQEGSQAAPLTVLIHLVLYEWDVEPHASALAHSLSREFTFGMEAIHCLDGDDLPGVLGASVLFVPPRASQNIDVGDEEDGKTPAHTLLDSLLGDGQGLHRYVTDVAVRDARCCHVIVYAPVNAIGSLIENAKTFSGEIVSSRKEGGKEPQVRQARGRVGLIVTMSASDLRVNNALETNADGDVDENDRSGLQDSVLLSSADLCTSEAFRQAHQRLRERVFALGQSKMWDASAVAFDANETPQSPDVELIEPALACSSMSWWEIRRLRPEQLRLLQTIATNVERTDDSGNHAYRSINAATERFYEALGKYPAAGRVIRNLGFTTPTSASAIEYDQTELLARLRDADRARMLKHIQQRIATEE